MICNNDTFGRISYYLDLERDAALSPQDREEVERWDHLKPGARPPKVLADLFEAIVGAVFLDHGFLEVDNWLRKIFEPILSAATKDYWYSTTRTLAFYRDHRNSTFSGPPHVQRRLVGYICSKREFFEDQLSDTIHTLPKNTIFYFDEHDYLEAPDDERLEVATHFLNLCICHTMIRIFRQYGHAKAKAAHLSSALTGVGAVFFFTRCSFPTENFLLDLISSDLTLSSLTSTLPLTGYFSRDMPMSTCKNTKLYKHPGTAHQLALVFKATIGWYYRAHPRSSAQWAYEWLEPLVKRAHDLLVEDPRYVDKGRHSSRKIVLSSVAYQV